MGTGAMRSGVVIHARGVNEPVSSAAADPDGRWAPRVESSETLELQEPPLVAKPRKWGVAPTLPSLWGPG